MRPTARLPALSRSLPALAAVLTGPAHADTPTVTAEAGAEHDSNVQRVETGPGLSTEPVATGLLRFGVRIDHRGRAAGGSYTVNASDLTRVVASDQVSAENVTVLAGNLRWLRRLGDRPVFAGTSLTVIDALPLSSETGARTFRNLGADGVLMIRAREDRSLTLGVGVRDFVYKPDTDFDWRGASASARLELVLWQAPAHTRSLELVTSLGFDARAFDSVALANACAPAAPADPSCAAPTDLARRDRYQRAGVELTWIGRQLAAIGYQLAVIDSNSYGQSLARHRVNLSVTSRLPGALFGTLLAILQVDQYLDGLVVRRDLQSQLFTTIEDENRSSLQLRLARAVSRRWSFEARAAVWRNLVGGAMALDFQRELLYLGVTYGK